MSEFKVLAQSVIGSAHIKNQKVCQDSSIAIDGNNYAAIAVSDGHGGDKHFRSDIGSALAVEVFKDAVPGLISAIQKGGSEKYQKRLLKDFEKHLILRWREEVNNELIICPFIYEELAPFSDKEREEIQNNPHIAFGATFLSAIACNGKLFVIQLGDGNCLIEAEDSIVSPIAEDESLKFSRTNSLCDSDAFGHIRDAVIPMPISGCVLASDGVRNSFDTEEHFNICCKTFIQGLSENLESFGSELAVFLPKLTAEGSSDDVSVAVLI